MTRRWLKRLASPAWWPIDRKAKKFVVIPRGPHAQDASLPLTVIIRNILELASTAKEARHIIKAAKISVDGRKRRDVKYGVGPMDIIGIDGVGTWRAVPGRRLWLVKTTDADSKLKLCRVIGKRNVRGNKLQVSLHDGRNMLADVKCSVNDTLMLEVREQKVVEHFKFEPGAVVLVTKGNRAGSIARLEKIERRLNRVWFTMGDTKFEAPIDAAFVVGNEKPAVKLSE
jgi:small subunit ribosomal protein S4e